MITTKIYPCYTKERLSEVLPFTTKDELCEAIRLMGYRPRVSDRKQWMIDWLADHILNHTEEVWSRLSQESINLIGDLVEAGKGNSVSIPCSDRFNQLQKMHLVVTYEKENEDVLFMLDEVHDVFKKVMDAQLDSMMQATEKYVERKKKEIEEAAVRKNEPVVFSPALTRTPPFYPESQEERAARIIRPRTIEVVTRLDDDLYSVCYLVDTQSDYVHVCTCWGNVLDFVWNGMDVNPFDGYYEPKKHFRKKYPRITNLFGQKEDKDGKLLPEPYLTTIGFNFQPKEWFLSYRVYNQDWEKLCMFSALFIDEITDACDELIDASFDICDEIQRSDAKGVQARLQEYMFGQ